MTMMTMMMIYPQDYQLKFMQKFQVMQSERRRGDGELIRFRARNCGISKIVQDGTKVAIDH